MTTWKNKQNAFKNVRKETEDSIYTEVIPHEVYGNIVKTSSQHLRVYRSLKSIFYPPWKKSQVLKSHRETLPAIISIELSSPIQECCDMISNGYSPLVMSGRDNDLLVRTSALWPLRSKRYKSLTLNFLGKDGVSPPCMSTYIPNVLVFRGPKNPVSSHVSKNYIYYPYLNWEDCRIIEICFMEDIKKNRDQDLYGDDMRRIIRGKINCVFDVALRHSKGIDHLDSVVIGDVGCVSVQERNYYCDAILSLVPTYIHKFRKIVFSLHNNQDLYLDLTRLIDDRCLEEWACIFAPVQFCVS
jgi:hypothetical protein